MNVFSPHKFKPALHEEASHEDVWVPSTCALCYGTCSILAHRVDGKVIKIEGNPDSAVGKGRLCGKGVSGIMTHYDPNRLRYPMRRTNPKKGLYEDPGWKRISWDGGTRRDRRGAAQGARGRSAQAGRATHDHCHRKSRAVPRLRIRIRNAEFLGVRRRPALRQRRPSDQRDHARVVVCGSRLRIL